ncbi:Chromate resistance protein ChrB [Streptomyces griseorubiginosus]|uniref:Chromate resistance protein ChrB n=1 Tax=Streptomyces griseorubiginosus TaxID=67304 RepID=UPI00369E9524
MTAVENAGHRLGLAIKLEAEPSRHRVAAVRRELRKTGAFSLGQGIWAVPDVPVLGDGVARTLALTEKAGGQAMALTASGGGPQDAARLRELFGAARSADWAEFLADCGRFEEEPAKDIRIAKFTLTELEEGEQSPERLRGRHRDLTARAASGTPEVARAGERLGQRTAACEDYAERVFAALHETPGDHR